MLFRLKIVAWTDRQSTVHTTDRLIYTAIKLVVYN